MACLKLYWGVWLTEQWWTVLNTPLQTCKTDHPGFCGSLPKSAGITGARYRLVSKGLMVLFLSSEQGADISYEGTQYIFTCYAVLSSPSKSDSLQYLNNFPAQVSCRTPESLQ